MKVVQKVGKVLGSFFAGVNPGIASDNEHTFVFVQTPRWHGMELFTQSFSRKCVKESVKREAFHLAELFLQRLRQRDKWSILVRDEARRSDWP